MKWCLVFPNMYLYQVLTGTGKSSVMCEFFVLKVCRDQSRIASKAHDWSLVKLSREKGVINSIC